MKHFYAALSEKFDRGKKDVADRRSEWPFFEKWVVDFLNQKCQDASKFEYYNNLHVKTSKDVSGTSFNNKSFVQLDTGFIVTGISTETVNEQGISCSGVFEGNATLSILQLPTGGVLMVVFPTHSDVMKFKEKFIILRYFSSPKNVQYKDVKFASDFFLRYALWTSIFGNMTLCDRIEHWWYLNRHKFIKKLMRVVNSGLHDAILMQVSPV